MCKQDRLQCPANLTWVCGGEHIGMHKVGTYWILIFEIQLQLYLAGFEENYTLLTYHWFSISNSSNTT